MLVLDWGDDERGKGNFVCASWLFVADEKKCQLALVFALLLATEI
jgi:hypothetical protein